MCSCPSSRAGGRCGLQRSAVESPFAHLLRVLVISSVTCGLLLLLMLLLLCWRRHEDAVRKRHERAAEEEQQRSQRKFIINKTLNPVKRKYRKGDGADLSGKHTSSIAKFFKSLSHLRLPRSKSRQSVAEDLDKTGAQREQEGSSSSVAAHGHQQQQQKQQPRSIRAVQSHPEIAFAFQSPFDRPGQQGQQWQQGQPDLNGRQNALVEEDEASRVGGGQTDEPITVTVPRGRRNSQGSDHGISVTASSNTRREGTSATGAFQMQSLSASTSAHREGPLRSPVGSASGSGAAAAAARYHSGEAAGQEQVSHF